MMAIRNRIADTTALVKCWELLDRRNRDLGWERYDFGDVQSHWFLRRCSSSRFGRLVVRGAQIPELLAPIAWRRLLGIERKLIPSVFYHLGMTYLRAEKLTEFSAIGRTESEAIAAEALSNRLEAAEVCWGHPYIHHAGQWRRRAERSGAPPSCAHHTGRVGVMLLRVGLAHQREEWISAGISAAEALLTYHEWRYHDDGTCTLSYYPCSDDEVINTGADAAVLLSTIPPTRRTDAMQRALEGLVKMVVSEQTSIGAWYYCTRRDYRRRGLATKIRKKEIDHLHSAMNLAALAGVVGSGALSDDLETMARAALEKGLRYYLTALVRPNGTGVHVPGLRRETGVVGYAEGISALCEYLRTARPSSERTPTVRDLLPVMLSRATGGFVNWRSGDVACYRFFGRPYQIQSARWGSVPLMQAITDYMSVAPAGPEGRCRLSKEAPYG